MAEYNSQDTSSSVGQIDSILNNPNNVHVQQAQRQAEEVQQREQEAQRREEEERRRRMEAETEMQRLRALLAQNAETTHNCIFC
ncbi:hypothetical protein AX17_002940 [Amanita inopinata Kibby_2008]|nr:hypothetical protein AX17_002940 [Amanita inopinata Kibby_2008]